MNLRLLSLERSLKNLSNYLIIDYLQGNKYELKYDGMYYLKLLHARPTDAGELTVVARNVKVC